MSPELEAARARLPLRRTTWRSAVFTASLLHGSVLVAASFIPVPTAAEHRTADLEEEVAFQLDLRSSRLFEVQAAAPAPVESRIVAPAAEEPPEEPELATVEPPPAEPEVVPMDPIVETPPEVEPPVEPEPVELAATPVAEPPIESEPAADAAPGLDEAPEAAAGRGAPNAETTAKSVVGAHDGTPTPAEPAAVPAAPAQGPVAAARTSASDASDAGAAGKRDLPPGSLHPRRAPKPEYPEGARRRGEEGTVTCRLTLDREGFVLDVELVTSSGHRELDDAAVRTLKRWRFEPLGGLTTANRAYGLQRLTFTLDKRRS